MGRTMRRLRSHVGRSRVRKICGDVRDFYVVDPPLSMKFQSCLNFNRELPCAARSTHSGFWQGVSERNLEFRIQNVLANESEATS
jgi:hypothetical protein